MTQERDIVTRLRDCTCVPHGEICREAAEEIMQLRQQVTELGGERDEARRWCCELWATDQIISQNTGMTPADYAAETGWDCFKEKP